ncbi:leucine-rich repeat protein [Mycoplasmopsis adleri]|uniref:leucine-rich repeat protein n=1 Tax=Mycoplasmopsis adleri TaxID=51362 RepID=UPI003872BCB6
MKKKWLLNLAGIATFLPLVASACNKTSDNNNPNGGQNSGGNTGGNSGGTSSETDKINWDDAKANITIKNNKQPKDLYIDEVSKNDFEISVANGFKGTIKDIKIENNKVIVSYELSKGNETKEFTKEFTGFKEINWNDAQVFFEFKDNKKASDFTIDQIGFDNIDDFLDYGAKNKDFQFSILSTDKDGTVLKIKYLLTFGSRTKEEIYEIPGFNPSTVAWNEAEVVIKNADELRRELPLSVDWQQIHLVDKSSNKFEARILSQSFLIPDDDKGELTIQYVLTKDSLTSGIKEIKLTNMRTVTNSIDWSQYTDKIKEEINPYNNKEDSLPSEYFVLPDTLYVEGSNEIEVVIEISGHGSLIPNDKMGTLIVKYRLENATTGEISPLFEYVMTGFLTTSQSKLREILTEYVEIKPLKDYGFEHAACDVMPKDLEYVYNGNEKNLKIEILETNAQEHERYVKVKVKLTLDGIQYIGTKSVWGFMTKDEYINRPLKYTSTDGNTYTLKNGVVVSVEWVNKENIVMPKEATQLNKTAFENNKEVETIELTNVEVLGRESLADLTKLQSIKGDKLKKILARTFIGNKELTTIDTPNVIYVESGVYNRSSFDRVKYFETFDSDGLIMIGKTVIAMDPDSPKINVKDYKFPDKVISVGGGVLKYNAFETIDMNNVEYLAEDNFIEWYSSPIKKIDLKNVKYLFGELGVGSNNLFKNQNLEDQSFKELEEINLGKITEISSEMLNGLKSLKKIIGNEVTKVSSGNALTNLPSLETAEMPKVVDFINSPLSSGSEHLIYPKDGFYLFGGKLIGYKGAGGDITIAKGIKAIGYGAFKNAKLTKVNLSDVERIEAYAFEDNPDLTEITGTDHLTFLGNYIFKGCHKIEKFDYDKSKVKYQENEWSTFDGSNLQK